MPQSPGDSTAGKALDAAQNLSTSAGSAAQQVVGTAKEQAAYVGQEASRQVGQLVDEARHQLRQRAEDQTGQLQELLRTWSRQFGALADGRVEEAGTAPRQLAQVADRLEAAAQHVEQRGFGGLVGDVQDLARRRPAAFLAGAALLGFATGRLLRGAKAGSSDEGPPASGQGSWSSSKPLPPYAEGAPGMPGQLGSAPLEAPDAGAWQSTVAHPASRTEVP